MFKRLLLDHPRSVGESYSEHFGVAAGFGGSLILAGLACMVHAIVPCLFQNTASRRIEQMHERLMANPRRAQRLASTAPPQRAT